MAKQFAFDAEAREKLRRGFDQLADAVRVTLGPRGRNVVLDRASGASAITNDGVTIAKEIVLPDPFENIGAELAREVSVKTQETAGDGTTTAVVLAQALVHDGLRAVASGVNPMGVKRGMERAAAAVLAAVSRESRAVRGDAEVQAVALLASRQDEVLARLVAESLSRVGSDGVVTVEEGKTHLTTLDVVEGMRFDQGYLSPYFVTDPERMAADLEDPFLLVADSKISAIGEIEPVLRDVAGTGRPLLLVAEEVDGEALATLVVNRLRGTLVTAAVKAPGYGERRRGLLEDLAVLTGAALIAEDAGRSLESVRLPDLGQAARIVVGARDTLVVGGRGRKAEVEKRIRQLRRWVEEATSDYDREQLRERVAKMAGGVGVLRVGGATALELHERKGRAEDALSATRAAVEEGIVLGGGAALLRASAVLGTLGLSGPEEMGSRVLGSALAAPLIQIAENAGYPGRVAAENVRQAGDHRVGFNALTGRIEDLARANVWDPTKVVRSALQNAVSIAGLVFTTETLVVDLPDEPEADGEADSA